MAPKKKDGGEDDEFNIFWKVYEKMQREYETEKIPEMQKIRQKRIDEGEEIKSWNFDEKFEPMAFRLLFQALKQTNYLDVEAIRLWQCGGGDDSVRSVCSYLDMEQPPNVKDLHFTDNGVTPLGCEFLGRSLGPKGNKVVNLLRLDYNPFGTVGVRQLAMGLSQNSTLRQLSLQYCAIGEDGGECIASILSYYASALEKLELRGNYLGDRGILDVFHGCKRAKALVEVDVFDNKFSDKNPRLITVLKELFLDNKSISKYNLSGNQISDAGAATLIQFMKLNNMSHLTEVKVPERVAQKTFEALGECLGGGGKKKKGKK